MIIGFGRWNPYYYYILISIISKFLKEDILGFGADADILYDVKIDHHPILILLIGFLSDFLVGFFSLLYIFVRKNKKQKEKEKNEELEREKNTFGESPTLNSRTSKENLSINDSQLELDEENKRINSLKSDSFKYDLIHNDLTNINLGIIRKNSLKFIIISSCLILLKELLTKIIYDSNDIFDYYFLNLITITVILRIFFKEKIYNHQILSIILVSIISGACNIGCIFIHESAHFLVNDFNQNSEDNKDKINLTYGFGNKYYKIFILIILYIIISISFCTGIIFQKNLMQLKFVRYQNILLWKGFIGTFLCIIGLIVSSNIICNNQRISKWPIWRRNDNFNNNNTTKSKENYNDNNGDNGLLDIFVCADFYKNNSYFDHFISYFYHLRMNFNETKRFNFNKNITNKYNLNEQITIEVFMIFGYFILHAASEISLILVNKFLTPLHYLITESMFSLLHISVETTIKLVNPPKFNETFFNAEEEFKIMYNNINKGKNTRILKLAAVFVELIGYLIYMEVIHLNCCGLEKNIKRSIEKRAKIDAALDNGTDDDYNINDALVDDYEENN